MKLAKTILLWLLVATNTFAQTVEIPDPNLRQLIRDALELPTGESITQQQMLTLERLDAGGDRGISDLTGLEYAQNLTGIGLYHNPISDISPFAYLTKLTGFNLWGCQITDIHPLQNLINLQNIILGNNQITDITSLAKLSHLTYLHLSSNKIIDFSPLSNLANLEKLYIDDNLGTDFTPLQELNLIEFHYDEVCEISSPLPSARERIENRSFPSVFQTWDHVIGLDHLTKDQRTALHDLFWSASFQLFWDTTFTEPTFGLATSMAGNLSIARQVRQQLLDINPNMVFFVQVRLHNHGTTRAFPPDSEYWVRDSQGQVLIQAPETGYIEYVIDFFKPEVQHLLAQRIVAIAECGLFDGVFLDNFRGHGMGGEEGIKKWRNLFHTVRSQVRDDFLIIINANETKPTHYAEFINGTMMETGKDHPGGYSRPWLMKLENTLSWNEQNLREPRINCLEGEGMSIEPPDGPNNLRWMRLFTTLSLTHSDGYVLYTTGFRDLGGLHHDHLWHSFWDADLGYPIGSKAQLYENIDGLFIREFTNGWAVYNRSGKEQVITLPRLSTGFSSNKQDITHLLPNLDGEIYLRVGKPFDFNRDGTINVLDLILISQHFGSDAGDVNGDGITNILDLTLVAQQFRQ